MAGLRIPKEYAGIRAQQVRKDASPARRAKKNSPWRGPSGWGVGPGKTGQPELREFSTSPARTGSRCTNPEGAPRCHHANRSVQAGLFSSLDSSKQLILFEL